jgi:predicted dehydrogenase
VTQHGPVRIGVLGAADIAWRRVLPAIEAAPEAELVGVASRDLLKAQRFTDRFGGRPEPGYAELLERADIEAVYVPLPAALHADWVERALLAGKHVLAEKPLTTERARTAELLALAKECGLVLMENVMFVHHPRQAAVRRLLEHGAIGELRSFRAAFAIPQLPPDDIRFQPELGGGALLDVGYYPVRAALHLLGGGLELVGATLERPADHRVETGGAALLRTPDGVSVHLTFGIGYAYRSEYELWGSKGRLRVDRAFTPPADHAPVLELVLPAGPERVELEPADQVAATVAAFTAAVRGRAAGDVTDHEAVLETAALLDAIRRQG